MATFGRVGDTAAAAASLSHHRRRQVERKSAIAAANIDHVGAPRLSERVTEPRLASELCVGLPPGERQRVDRPARHLAVAAAVAALRH